MNQKVLLLLAVMALMVAGSLAGGLMAGSSLAQSGAGVPSSIHYQGVLCDPVTGDPVADGGYNFVFSIYNVATGGTPLWTETQTGVTVDDGYFSVLLGSVNPLDASDFDGTTRYLGIKVGADSEMTPRQLLASVPYALNAETVDGLDAGDLDDLYVNESGDSMSGATSDPVLSVTNTGGGYAIKGIAEGVGYGVFGEGIHGVHGFTESTTGTGVYGRAMGTMGTGVYGYAPNDGYYANYGGSFKAAGLYGRGVYAEATGQQGRGIYAKALGTDAYAGYFQGDVHIDGDFTVDGDNTGVGYNPMQIALLKWYTSGHVFTVGGWDPTAVCFDGANIWVANEYDGTVTKLTASSGSLVGTYSVGDYPSAVCFDGANIWVANYSDDTMTKLTASSGSLVGTYSVGDGPRAVCFDGANIWVANRDDDTVTKLRASDGSLVGTYNVGSTPWGVAFDGANIWVTNALDDTVTKLRASDGSLVGTYSVGSTPRAVCFDGAYIWVANYSSNTVTKL